MSSGDDTGERNPFAPPPADAPDQPWQPRTPPPGSSSPEGEDDRGLVPPPHPWSPGHRGNGWGTPPPAPPQPKFDPNDPVQRRSRHALMAGMGGLFCVVLGIPYVALLLGALAAYWGISTLRANHRPNPDATPSAAGPQPVRPQTPAAVGGLVTGGVTVLFVLASLGVTLYYQDYVTCVSEALTAQAADSCDNLAPSIIVNLYNPGR
ncbi:hypothetical protein ACIA8O_27800 [Kitasatospora sp. NPDC051853]|uniref:hypothetical protein n=1 Tax=Kitasatospora sp. NPDC051853 TaxID=3364058 RepID=UPI0037B13166